MREKVCLHKVSVALQYSLNSKTNLYTDALLNAYICYDNHVTCKTSTHPFVCWSVPHLHNYKAMSGVALICPPVIMLFKF